MKKLFLSTLFIILSAVVLAQKDTASVLEAVNRLATALVNKDEPALKPLLHPELAFGHSNGWVQNRLEVLKDMKSGYLVYRKINRQSIAIESGKKYASVRERIEVEGSRDGNEFKLSIFVLQMWVKTKKGWQLLGRQSTKIG
jgi:hypothetical protein